MGSNTTPEITLYTSYQCPWAHRAQIALKELGLEFKTEHIDLSVPRTAEYLKVNPRGLVPSLKYGDEIITESGIVAQFLADAHPSHLLKTSTEAGGALQRARIAYFVDAWFSKVQSNVFPIYKASGAEKAELAEKLVDAIVKEIEPLLAGAGPFFGGAEKFTLAEVLTGPFVLRVIAFAKYPELFPKSLLGSLESKAPKFYGWASEVVKQESVTYIWDEEKLAKGHIKRFDARI
ncbi:glutathione S-transferase domain-containing protein [Halenospora varia]|nr:glutathione S-transferase domain-containing protein [Halenospora varia]